MTVRRLDQTEQSLYSKFVAAHESGSFLQSWSWGEFQNQLGKICYRYGVFDNTNNLIATAQLLDIKVPYLGGRYLYCPYGPLISAESLPIRNIIFELINKLKIDFPKHWFIRIEPKEELPIQGQASVHIQPGSTLITDLSLSEDQLLVNMHQKTRYNIKVAEKHGITIEFNSVNPEPAIVLLVNTSDRQGYKSYPVSYYERLLEFFNQASSKTTDSKMHLYTAYHQGNCIASAIMVDHGATRTYLFGGSDNHYRNLMAPYALHWKAMQDAKLSGLTNYDWWGTETATGNTPGFVQFKLRWGGIQKHYATAKDIVLNSLWYRAYSVLRKINRVF